MQQNNQGWELFRRLNEGIGKATSLELRKLLAEYMNSHMERPSKLHSAMLSAAVRMATQYPDFHFVSFLNLWGLEYLRSEDSECGTDINGKRIPSLVERLGKAYSYSLVFHPTERLDHEIESIIAPLIEKVGTIPTAVGYVDYIDLEHSHIHVFDNQSRHFVAIKSPIMAQVGQYVQFIPNIPQNSKFKTAIIYHVYQTDEGMTAFGHHKAQVTSIDSEGKYVGWKLTDDTTIIEAGTTEPSYTSGYLSEQLLKQKDILPKVDDRLKIIVFLKRSKDGKKRPVVVDFKIE